MKLNIDWAMLRKQKITLLSTFGKLNDQEQEALNGIIHLIDAIQDEAVANGYPEKEVFGSNPPQNNPTQNPD